MAPNRERRPTGGGGEQRRPSSPPTATGSDPGWLEVDTGQYDEPADVDAWCGGAVLLRREYLDDVGYFDERLFLYYEDVELSLRGAARGWRYRTAPAAVVRHVHSATATERSPLAAHYNERNRLLVTTRHAGPSNRRPRRWALPRDHGVVRERDIVAPLLARRIRPTRDRSPADARVGAYVRGDSEPLRGEGVTRRARGRTG